MALNWFVRVRAAGLGALLTLCGWPCFSWAAGLQLTGVERWIVLASRQDVDEAIGLARRFGHRVPGVRVVRANNGWFAVILGPSKAGTIAAAKADLKARLGLPDDAYLSRGEGYVEQVWQSPPSPVLAQGHYDGKAPARIQLGELSVLLDSVRLPSGDRVPIATGRLKDRVVFTARIHESPREPPESDAQIVRLDPSAGQPQVLFKYFWSGAHCCTVTKIATASNGGAWRVIDAATLDADGYLIEDIDGDGAAELVSVDNSFLYAFAPYVVSFPPPHIHRLSNGTLRDVTRNPAFQPYLRQELRKLESTANKDPALWRSNGFLAGWVAAKAQLGEVDQAWGRMLTSYDRNPDFGPEECTIGLPLDKCPEPNRRRMAFPEALRSHLLSHGYPGPGTPAGSLTELPRAAADAQFPNAQAAFNKLLENERYDLQMMLIATGHWSAVSTDQFSRRLFLAIQRFQVENGLPVNGMIGPDQIAVLRTKAGPVLQRWGLAPAIHPLTGTKLWIPKGLGLAEKPSKTGIEFLAPDRSVMISFDFFPDLPLKAAFDALVDALQPPVQVNYKVLRSDFFVAAYMRGEIVWYTRYHVTKGGIIGFTVIWKPSDAVLGDRLSTIMSDIFRANVSLGLDRAPPSIVAPVVATAPPVTASPPASPVTPTVPVETPRPAVRSTGTGFFVTADGHILTNAHVIGDCASISVVFGQEGSREARLIARDATNDLALLKTSVVPSSVATFRSGPRLGENVAVFGYPLTGLLTSSGNFTLGNITALAGIRDDSRMLQISAPVQPGNSGGPLLDEGGNVIGIVVAKLNVLRLAAATDDLAQNVNFAIKDSVARSFAEAQGIRLGLAQSEAKPMRPADLADRAKSFTTLVECRK